MASEPLERLYAKTREIEDLRGILDQLSWDQEVMMPKKGGGHRARQISTLASLKHGKLIDPELGGLIGELSSGDGLDPWAAASLRKVKRAYERAVKLPSSLVRELAMTQSLAYEAWVEAREDSDFPAFAPHLEKMIGLQRQAAKCLSEGGPLYDALHEEYEPGMSCRLLDELFAVLRPRLSGLLERIQSSPRQPDRSLLRRPVRLKAQQALGREILGAMGFDWQAGRLDVSPHPFCVGISPSDVRMTTRYAEDDLSRALFGMIHEGGHGLYEQGLDASRYGQPVASAVSLGIHESQSRLWENTVARSRAFWKHFLPRLRKLAPTSFADVKLEDWVRAVNLVEASFIRVEADEVTYGLHIILRYEIERALIQGELEVKGLDRLWNDKMEEYLGIRPANAAEGILQDTHWSQGLIGYFPTYLLGNVYAAQLFAAAEQQVAGLQESIERGDLAPLRNWLRENVHLKGSLREPPDLILEITGKKPEASFFLDYLEDKFSRLYRL